MAVIFQPGVTMKRFLIIALSLALCIITFGCSSDAEAERSSVSDAQNACKDNDTNAGDKKSDENPADAYDKTLPGEPDEDLSVDPNATAGDWGIFPFKFTAEDIYGNTVTEESLGSKQLFFVHLWATWCPPCVVEMPDLAVIARDYDDRVGFIGLLDDFSSNLSGAKDIVESASIPDSFIMVDAHSPALRELLPLVRTGYVPTTVLFTASGQIFDPPLIGAYGLGYAEILDVILQWER
jgi:thiol-disulfide isomerase/thioredoxin